MDRQETGKGFGALENIRISILVLGDKDRVSESQAMAQSMGKRHEVVLFSPRKTNLLSKLAATRAATEVKPHIIHALGLGGVAASAPSIANGMNTALVISLSRSDLDSANARKLVQASKQAKAFVVETEEEADILREASVKRDIYVTAAPQLNDTQSHRLYLGAIEIVYGRLIDPDKLPKPVLDSEGSPLVSLGRLSKGGKI